jgi:hypothetical protein
MCAAVAAVVAVCVLALAYSHSPFRFLSGAKLSSGGAMVFVPGPKDSVLYTAYRAEGPMDALVEKAREELASDPDWVWGTNEFGDPACTNAAQKQTLQFHVDPEGMAADPHQVSVVHSRPATFLDRLRDWIDRRSR